MLAQYYRCSILRPAIAVLLWMAMVFPSVVRAQTSEEEDSETIVTSTKFAAHENNPDLSQVAKLIIQKTNQFRRDEELSPVAANAALNETAQYFAEYMAKTDRYGHTADGNRPSQRAREHGYEFCIVAENIAYQYSSVGFATEELAERFFQGWKNSPAHRKNMLDGAVTETGVAVAQSQESGHFYAVQMFGRPKSKRIEFQIANESEMTVEYRIGERTFSLPPRYTRTHQRCRPPEMTLGWKAESKAQTKTVHPKSGDKFVVTGQGESLKIERE